MASKKSQPDQIEVRILVDTRLEDGTFLPCNSTPTLPADVANALVANGAADANTEAIKAAKAE